MLKVECLEYSPKLSRLCKKYGEVLQFVQDLPRGRLEEVEGAVPGAVEHLITWQDTLGSSHTTILVSGKSKQKGQK